MANISQNRLASEKDGGFVSGRFDCILIGASAGGVTAIQYLLRGLSSKLGSPLLIVQHLPATSRVNMTQVYGVPTGYRIVEVEDKMPIEPYRIYMATNDYHVSVEADFTFSLSQDEAVNFSRPSIDVCFSSAALAFRDRALGILLTGANADGADGLRTMSQLGATTIVQDPNDAEFASMPQAALDMFKPSYVLSVEGIQTFLKSLAQQGHPTSGMGVEL